ncbi:dehydrogenase/reductase SDR family member on chromosome X-like [Pecten maximus]|uniref:dehydrogenase/reductase SDR family member on chromosome X-like n=1 Tax=Pecten maximus TaxID=6579 RepID=UPI0014587909|nr:dehydrogenase/reductase SDR family member on chromosome X-like [Pecten maximus]
MECKQSFPLVSLPSERVVVITGANQGIGYHTAKWIAMMGATVIIACRSEEKAKQAIDRMNTEFNEEKEKGTKSIVDLKKLNVTFMRLDNASLKSVMTFVDHFKATGLKLHVLICNAGIGRHKQEYTDDGNELIFQVNYLSHFLLTAQLLPIMKTSGPDCRVILVSGGQHIFASFQLDEIQGKQFTEDAFDGLHYYRRSKLYQIMQMFSMNRRLADSNVTVTSLHPGGVETGLLDAFDPVEINIQRQEVRFKSPFEGSWTTINAAVNPALSGVRDVFFCDSKPSTETAGAQARDEFCQEQLWKYTLTCLKDYLSEDVVKTLGWHSTDK